MFVIRPVDDKNIQEELCGLCGCAYLPEDFAYFAANLSDDGSKLLGILGLCQFRMQDGCGVIHGIVPFPGTFDEEVMIIMARTAMEFVHRCGCEKMLLAENACDREFGEKLGFRMEDGIYTIDLVQFYKSPCGYQAKLKNDEK